MTSLPVPRVAVGVACLCLAAIPSAAGDHCGVDGVIETIDGVVFEDILDIGGCGTTCRDTGCGEAGCDGFAGRLESQDGLRWIGGVEATFLAPSTDDNFATITTGPFGVVARTIDDDLDGFFGAPRVWFGADNCGWQIVGRYWDLNGTAGEDIDFNPLAPVDDVTTDLDVYTIDLEIARRFSLACVDDSRIFFGVRYAEFDVDSSIATREVINTSVVTAFAATESNFSGPGITFGGAGAYPIGCRGFELFWAGRGSVLFGETSAAALTAATGVNPLGSANALNVAFGHADDNLFVTELQLGGQYRRPVRCICGTLFVRAAFEYQHWAADEGFAFSTSFANTTDASATATSFADGVDLDLIGFNVGAGINW